MTLGNMSPTEANALSRKTQSSITLALIDWYCYIPGIQYVDGAWLSGYETAFNATNVNFNDQSGFVYTQDLAAAAAVSVINSRSDILPYTTVNIKRFSDCGHYWPQVETQFNGQTTGFSMAKVAIPIGETHTDVVAVVGGQYSSVAKMLTATGFGDHLALLYKSWNVKRVAVICQQDDLMSSSLAQDVYERLNNHEIAIVSVINLKTALTQDMVEYAAITLRQSGARYIYLSGQTGFVSKIYFSLALLGMVGPEFVFTATNPPQRISTDMSLLSSNLTMLNDDIARMGNLISGFIAIFSQGDLPNSPWMQIFYDAFVSLGGFDEATKTAQGFDTPLNLLNYWGVGRNFDCVMLLMLGMDKLVGNGTDFGPSELASRKLSPLLNYTQFLNLDYPGLTSNPVSINGDGDLQLPFTAWYYNGSANLNITGLSQNPFYMTAFARTDVSATSIESINNTLPAFFGGTTLLIVLYVMSQAFCFTKAQAFLRPMDLLL
ncbi:hypothetical protein HDU98_006290 [Podochytrium sp. JEL0797]|nr:hypothetical protein HDU98_006290 [Podochytrium sp. JEL0797]